MNNELSIEALDAIAGGTKSLLSPTQPGQEHGTFTPPPIFCPIPVVLPGPAPFSAPPGTFER